MYVSKYGVTRGKAKKKQQKKITIKRIDGHSLAGISTTFPGCIQIWLVQLLNLARLGGYTKLD